MAAEPEEGFSEGVCMARRELIEQAKDEAVQQEGRSSAEPALKIPLASLPAALTLLTQVNREDLVLQLAPALLESYGARMHRQDVLLALATAHCARGRALLLEGRTACGYGELEQAHGLLQDGGPALRALPLCGEIAAGLAELEVPRILDELAVPRQGAAGQASRERALLSLRALLGAPVSGSPAATVQVDAACVALAVSYMDVVEVAHAADWAWVAQKAHALPWASPALLTTAVVALATTAFRSHDPSLAGTACSMAKAMAGSAEAAATQAVCEVLLGETRRAAAALRAASQRPNADPALGWQWPAGEEFAFEGATVNLPAAREAYAFVRAHSPAEERDLLPGLCLFVEVWLAKVAFPMFLDTKEAPPSTSLVQYFDSVRVEHHLDQAAQPPGAAVLRAVREGLVRVPQFVQQAALRITRLPGELQRGLEPAAGGQAGDSEASGSGAQPHPHGRAMLVAVSLAAAGSMLVAAVALTSRRAGPPPHSITSGAAAATPRGQVAQLSAAAARQLVLRWHAAKARLMGPGHEAQGLADVLAPPALHDMREEAARLAESGWFFRYRLHSARVLSLRSDTERHAVVVALLHESSLLFGVDGRQEDAYNSQYEAEYHVACGSDGIWRIAAIKVLGREPGGLDAFWRQFVRVETPKH